mmetsp:Transcript_13785/g.37346  ORF Transcript_13785/g.37346 Transcript_13785/m.37346 type:complete len:292 (+) Transcript_13785:380-1255(+)
MARVDHAAGGALPTPLRRCRGGAQTRAPTRQRPVTSSLLICATAVQPGGRLPRILGRLPLAKAVASWSGRRSPSSRAPATDTSRWPCRRTPTSRPIDASVSRKICGSSPPGCTPRSSASPSVPVAPLQFAVIEQLPNDNLPACDIRQAEPCGVRAHSQPCHVSRKPRDAPACADFHRPPAGPPFPLQSIEPQLPRTALARPCRPARRASRIDAGVLRRVFAALRSGTGGVWRIHAGTGGNGSLYLGAAIASLLPFVAAAVIGRRAVNLCRVFHTLWPPPPPESFPTWMFRR